MDIQNGKERYQRSESDYTVKYQTTGADPKRPGRSEDVRMTTVGRKALATTYMSRPSRYRDGLAKTNTTTDGKTEVRTEPELRGRIREQRKTNSIIRLKNTNVVAKAYILERVRRISESPKGQNNKIDYKGSQRNDKDEHEAGTGTDRNYRIR